MDPIVGVLASLHEEADEEHVGELLRQAATLVQAANEKVAPAVDELASALRSQLAGLDYDESVEVATDLLVRYGEDPGTSQGALPIGNHERRKGPDPASSGMYQPGQAAWWENTTG